MALINRRAAPGIDALTLLYTDQDAGHHAGEDLDPAAPCYIAADGLVYMSTGAADNKAAHVDGWTIRKVLAGEAVTLHCEGVRIKYSDGGLTPGDNYYLSATKGRLDTVPSVGGTRAIARARDASHIRTISLA